MALTGQRLRTLVFGLCILSLLDSTSWTLKVQRPKTKDQHFFPYLGARLIRLVGEGGVHIATRVMGIVLAALAVQYVLNGVTGYYQLLRGR